YRRSASERSGPASSNCRFGQEPGSSTRGQGQPERRASRHLRCSKCLQLYATVSEPWIAEQRVPLASYEIRLGLVTRHKTALQSGTHPPLDARTDAAHPDRQFLSCPRRRL